VPYDDWQGPVLELLAQAAIVVLQVGTSPGLSWEVDQVVALNSPERAVLLIGEASASSSMRTDHGASVYGQFRQRFESVFPKGLPADVAGSVFIAFSGDWTPVPSMALSSLPTSSPDTRDVLVRLHRRLSGRRLH
jgi:hypothetical protein